MCERDIYQSNVVDESENVERYALGCNMILISTKYVGEHIYTSDFVYVYISHDNWLRGLIQIVFRKTDKVSKTRKRKYLAMTIPYYMFMEISKGNKEALDSLDFVVNDIMKRNLSKRNYALYAKKKGHLYQGIQNAIDVIVYIMKEGIINTKKEGKLEND